MTNTHKVLQVLREADKPLSGAEVFERIESDSVRKTSVYSILKRMSEKGKVFRDENYEGCFSVMYQLKQSRVRSSNKKQR